MSTTIRLPGMSASCMLAVGNDGRVQLEEPGKRPNSLQEKNSLFVKNNSDGTIGVFLVPRDGEGKGKMFAIIPTAPENMVYSGWKIVSENEKKYLSPIFKSADKTTLARENLDCDSSLVSKETGTSDKPEVDRDYEVIDLCDDDNDSRIKEAKEKNTHEKNNLSPTAVSRSVWSCLPLSDASGSLSSDKISSGSLSSAEISSGSLSSAEISSRVGVSTTNIDSQYTDCGSMTSTGILTVAYGSMSTACSLSRAFGSSHSVGISSSVCVSATDAESTSNDTKSVTTNACTPSSVCGSLINDGIPSNVCSPSSVCGSLINAGIPSNVCTPSSVCGSLINAGIPSNVCTPSSVCGFLINAGIPSNACTPSSVCGSLVNASITSSVCGSVNCTATAPRPMFLFSNYAAANLARAAITEVDKEKHLYKFNLNSSLKPTMIQKPLNCQEDVEIAEEKLTKRTSSLPVASQKLAQNRAAYTSSNSDGQSNLQDKNVSYAHKDGISKTKSIQITLIPGLKNADEHRTYLLKSPLFLKTDVRNRLVVPTSSSNVAVTSSNLSTHTALPTPGLRDESEKTSTDFQIRQPLITSVNTTASNIAIHSNPVTKTSFETRLTTSTSLVSMTQSFNSRISSPSSAFCRVPLDTLNFKSNISSATDKLVTSSTVAENKCQSSVNKKSRKSVVKSKSVRNKDQTLQSQRVKVVHSTPSVITLLQPSIVKLSSEQSFGLVEAGQFIVYKDAGSNNHKIASLVKYPSKTTADDISPVRVAEYSDTLQSAKLKTPVSKTPCRDMPLQSSLYTLQSLRSKVASSANISAVEDKRCNSTRDKNRKSNMSDIGDMLGHTDDENRECSRPGEEAMNLQIETVFSLAPSEESLNSLRCSLSDRSSYDKHRPWLTTPKRMPLYEVEFWNMVRKLDIPLAAAGDKKMKRRCAVVLSTKYNVCSKKCRELHVKKQEKALAKINNLKKLRKILYGQLKLQLYPKGYKEGVASNLRSITKLVTSESDVHSKPLQEVRRTTSSEQSSSVTLEDISSTTALPVKDTSSMRAKTQNSITHTEMLTQATPTAITTSLSPSLLNNATQIQTQKTFPDTTYSTSNSRSGIVKEQRFFMMNVDGKNVLLPSSNLNSSFPRAYVLNTQQNLPKAVQTSALTVQKFAPYLPSMQNRHALIGPFSSLNVPQISNSGMGVCPLSLQNPPRISNMVMGVPCLNVPQVPVVGTDVQHNSESHATVLPQQNFQQLMAVRIMQPSQHNVDTTTNLTSSVRPVLQTLLPLSTLANNFNSRVVANPTIMQTSKTVLLGQVTTTMSTSATGSGGCTSIFRQPQMSSFQHPVPTSVVVSTSVARLSNTVSHTQSGQTFITNFISTSRSLQSSPMVVPNKDLTSEVSSSTASNAESTKYTHPLIKEPITDVAKSKVSKGTRYYFVHNGIIIKTEHDTSEKKRKAYNIVEEKQMNDVLDGSREKMRKTQMMLDTKKKQLDEIRQRPV